MSKKIFLNIQLSILLILALPIAVGAITIPNPLCPQQGQQPCIDSFPALITNIIGYVLTVIGGLATIMFVWSGVLFVTSSGNPNKVDQAKKTAIYAVIGLAIALAGKGLILVIREVIGTPP